MRRATETLGEHSAGRGRTRLLSGLAVLLFVGAAYILTEAREPARTSTVPRTADHAEAGHAVQLGTRGAGSQPASASMPAAPNSLRARFAELAQQLVLATRAGGSGEAVSEAIARLATFICEQPRFVQVGVDRSLEWSRAGELRAATAMLTAIGRCAKHDVLGVLIGLFDSERLPREVAVHVPFVLAQRRVPALKMRAGSGIAVGDTFLDSAIQESFVREALMRWLDEAERELAERRMSDVDRRTVLLGTRMSVLRALGPSAGTFEEVTQTYRRYLGGTIEVDSGVEAMLLAGLAVAENPEGVRDLARTAFYASRDPSVVQQAAHALLRAADSRDANELLAFAMDEAHSIELRIATMQGFQGIPLDCRDPAILSVLQRLAEYGVDVAQSGGHYVEVLPAMGYLYGAHGMRMPALRPVCAKFAVDFVMHPQTSAGTAERILASFRGRPDRQWFPELFEELSKRAKVTRDGLVALARRCDEFNQQTTWKLPGLAVLEEAAGHLPPGQMREVRSLVASIRQK